MFRVGRPAGCCGCLLVFHSHTAPALPSFLWIRGVPVVELVCEKTLKDAGSTFSQACILAFHIPPATTHSIAESGSGL